MIGVVDLVRGIIHTALQFILQWVSFIFEKFMDLHFFDKLIAFNCIAAFFAVVLSVGKYYIFETWYYLNNPLAVYLIGIVFVMAATMFLKHIAGIIARILFNAWYCAWMIYLHSSGTLSGAPYEITPGYYVNIIVPVLFIILTIPGYVMYERQ